LLLLVGLGNPGEKYARSRHNVGFMIADALQRRYGRAPFRGKFDGDLAEAEIAGEKVLLLEPTTYMNESGKSVGAASRFFKIPKEDVIVFHDEMDLALGKVRVKKGGGAAGHNGIRSVANHIGPQFRRVRVGIGHPGEKGRVVGHVLKDFDSADQAQMDKIVDAIVDAMPLLIEGDDGGFMSKVALIVNPPKPKPPKPDTNATGEPPSHKEE